MDAGQRPPPLTAPGPPAGERAGVRLWALFWGVLHWRAGAHPPGSAAHQKLRRQAPRAQRRITP